MLTYLADPLEKRKFGGSERDLETVTSFRNSVKLLEEKIGKEKDVEQQGQGDRPNRGWQKPWWRKQGEQAGNRDSNAAAAARPN